jgi:hypothetical protein
MLTYADKWEGDHCVRQACLAVMGGGGVTLAPCDTQLQALAARFSQLLLALQAKKKNDKKNRSASAALSACVSCGLA